MDYGKGKFLSKDGLKGAVVKKLIDMINEEFTCPEQKLTVESRKKGQVTLERGTNKIWYSHFVYELQVKPKYDYPEPVVYQIRISDID
jgi:hypothetical protein